ALIAFATPRNVEWGRRLAQKGGAGMTGRRSIILAGVVSLCLLAVSAGASTPGADKRLSRDYPGGGYVSAYTLATGNAYTDAKIRTASSGDPVLAWDAHGRLFAGSEASDDPAGSRKTFGDVWVATYDNPDGPTGITLNDGKRFVGSVIVNRGSSAPNLLGVFN